MLSGLLITSAVLAVEPELVVPIDAKLEYNHALDLYKMGKYEDAIAAFRTAIRLYPDYIDAYYNLGSILDYLNQHEQAINVFKQIVVRQPEEYEAVFRIAEISAKSGDRATASEYVALIPSTDKYFIRGKELQQKYGLIKSGPTKAEKIKQRSTAYWNIDSPTGIVTDTMGNVYVASFTSNLVLKITPDNRRMVFFKNPILNGPISMAIDSQNNIYIANYNANNVLKISRIGSFEVFIQDVTKPYSLHVSGDKLYVSSQGANAVIVKRLF